MWKFHIEYYIAGKWHRLADDMPFETFLQAHAAGTRLFSKKNIPFKVVEDN